MSEKGSVRSIRSNHLRPTDDLYASPLTVEGKSLGRAIVRVGLQIRRHCFDRVLRSVRALNTVAMETKQTIIYVFTTRDYFHKN